MWCYKQAREEKGVRQWDCGDMVCFTAWQTVNMGSSQQGIAEIVRGKVSGFQKCWVKMGQVAGGKAWLHMYML